MEFFVNFTGKKHLLNSYSSIIAADYEDIYVIHTNNFTKQNSKAVYQTLKNSINGVIKTTIFNQLGNILDNDDEPTLFILMR